MLPFCCLEPWQVNQDSVSGTSGHRNEPWSWGVHFCLILLCSCRAEITLGCQKQQEWHVFLCCRHSSQLSKQLAWVTRLPVRLRALGRRMHHLLWEHGRHSHLLLWTHVSLLFMWAEAQEDGQCLLPHLQTGHQRYHQNLPQHLEQQQMPWWGLGTWGGGCETTQVLVCIHHPGDSKPITHHHPDLLFHGQQMRQAQMLLFYPTSKPWGWTPVSGKSQWTTLPCGF